MIVACPSCKAKFRIDESRIQPPGVRLRCARCETMFAVRKRVVDAAPVVERETADAAAARADIAAAGPKILIAHESMAFLTGVRAQLEREGYEVLAARDGVEALMRIQRELPRAVVIDTALPKMYGFEICEFLKRNESLRGIRVVLVASDNGRARYKRNPGNLYGADDYLEIHDIPSALPGILRRLLGEEPAATPSGQEAESAKAGSGDVSPERAESRAAPGELHARKTPPPAPAAAVRPARAPAADDGLEPEREKARRLARIIVSDIALYNESVIQEGVRNGRLLEMLRDDLEEGYRLFRTRVPASIAEERDYVREALMALIEKKRRAAADAGGAPGAPAGEAWDRGDGSSGAGVEDDSF